MFKLSIIIPAYNEEKRIENTLKSYSEYFENLRENKILAYEILVVINNTTDKTEEIVQKLQRKNEKIRYICLKRGGKGHAITEGFKETLKGNSDLIGFVDADMSTSPFAFHELVKKIDGFDGIIASRYMKRARVSPKQTWQRVIVSRIFNFILRILFLFSYKDTQCGAKLFKRRPLENVLPLLTFSKWAFDVDLLYGFRRKGYKIRETPTIWADRSDSKINFMKAGPWMALGVIRLRILNSPFRRFAKVYDAFVGFMPK